MPKKDTSQAPLLRSDTPSSEEASSPQESNLNQLNRKFKEADVKLEASQKRIHYVNLSKIPISQEALQLTNLNEVQVSLTIPFYLSGNQVKIASTDPTSQLVKKKVEELQAKHYQVEIYLCSSESIRDTFKLFQAFEQKKEVQLIETISEQNESSGIELAEDIFLTPEQTEIRKAPELLNLINLAAVKTRASDVHFQPGDMNVPVRFRIDGMLKDMFILSKKKFGEVVNEIKKQSQLILNVALPQDGQYSFTVNKRKVGVRVSTFPSKYGESIVLRMLDSQKQKITLDRLGLSQNSSKKVNEALTKNGGLILATGPTGSGKTTTLYALLNSMNDPKRKIVTLEDPVEYEVKNTVQSEISEEDGYSFELGLRSILRQDPDIIMIGEIRDTSSAETSVQAALTGHQVLSTMHANSSVDAIPRLMNMGVKTYILSAALTLIIAQRLIRKLCECAEMVSLSQQERTDIQQVIDGLKKDGFKVDWALPNKVKKAKGCPKCARTGYAGREIIAETLLVNEELKDAILRESPRTELFQIARKNGFITIKEEAIRKVIAGETSMEEVWRGIG